MTWAEVVPRLPGAPMLGTLEGAPSLSLRQWPLGSVGWAGLFLGSGNLSHWDSFLWFFLLGWEGVWNRGPCVGKDQGLLLVACYGGVMEGHL